MLQGFIVLHLVRQDTLILVKMAHTVQLAHLYLTQLNALLAFTALLAVQYPNHAQQGHSPTLQEETDVILVQMDFTAFLWSLQEMNPLDTVSVQGGSTVLRELVLIGSHAQQVLTVIALACTMKNSVKTVMVDNSVMEGT